MTICLQNEDIIKCLASYHVRDPDKYVYHQSLCCSPLINYNFKVSDYTQWGIIHVR